MNSKNKNNSKDSIFLSWSFFFLLLVAVTVVTAVYGRIIYNNFSGFQEAGPFGDSFGALTSLFTALAFAGLIFTLFVQKNELSLQRAEFENLVNEQKNSNLILQNQSESIYQQNFENTFFNLIGEFRSTRDGIVYKPFQGTEFKGQLAIEKMADAAFTKIARVDCDSIDNEYLTFYKDYENDLGPYFRLLFHIFNFIDASRVIEKKFYTNILRAQLSSKEAQLLMINSASSLGKNKFLPLVKKYDLLKHLTLGPQMASDAGRHYAEIYKGSSFLDGVYLGGKTAQQS